MGASGSYWDEHDVVRMLRLSNRLHEWRAGAEAGRVRLQVLLEGVCEVAKAIVGVLVVGEVGPTGRAAGGGPRFGDLSCLHVFGADPDVCETLIAAGGSDPVASDPALRALLRRLRRRADVGAGPPLTLTRRELVDDAAWYASPHVRQVRRSAGVDDCVYSARVLECGAVACMCLCRKWGDRRRFDGREAKAVDVLHAECGWVYRDEIPSSRVKALPLSPRERQVLWKLLSGRGEKQIAGEMRLSQNTVHHYVKAIYRRLRVSSRAELLARWMGKESPES
jgi:DNA-binding CsgD family transcriptional regulator